MKKTIFSNWNFMRVLRLGIGIAILIQAILAKDVVFGIAGLLFSAMAVLNIVCCGTGGCRVLTKRTSVTTKDITYEEVV
jgi:hypothetical protein